MVFQSLPFFVFFLIVFTVYHRLSLAGQNAWLLLAGYIFYATWDWRFLPLLILSGAVTHGAGLAVFKTPSPVRKRIFLWSAVLFHLGILGFFKYSNFFLENVLLVLGRQDSGRVWLQFLLPAGISFYTFKAVSYVVDIYRKQIKPSASFLNTSLYLSFFPQVISGPIDSPAALITQIENPRRCERKDLYQGCFLIGWGLFQKVFVADNLARLADPVFSCVSAGSGEVLFSMYAYAFQLYFDFSGYSCMAWGIAKLLGFETTHNFFLPFFSPNIQIFWNRWHASLSLWVRDYLYTPVFIAAGFLKTELRLCAATLAAMFFIGLWHGAAWHFIFYGVYHGLLLCLYLLLRPRLFARVRPQSSFARAAWEWGRILFVFHLVAIGFLIFRSPSTAHFILLIKNLFADPLSGLLVRQPWADLLFYASPAVLIEFFQYRTNDRFAVFKWNLFSRAIVYILGFFLITLYGAHSVKEFIYFQF